MLAQAQCAIVGGGLLGMTLAYYLTREGATVTLFETAKEMGGLASAWQVGDVRWDRYYHVTLHSDTAVRSLLSDLNLDREMCWRKTKTGFYYQGRLLPLSNAVEFATFPLLGPIEKARLCATIVYASRLKNWHKLETVSVADWLTRLSGESVFRKIWLPLLKSKLGEDFQSTSATFIWATIQRLYAARRNGMKEELFGYLPGGYGRMLSTYHETLCKLGVTIRLNATVREVRQAKEREKVELTLSSGEVQSFDKVVVTAPGPLVSRLCPDLLQAEKREFAKIPYLGIICASVLLRRPLSVFYVTNLLDESLPFTGIIEMSALVDPAEFGNKHLIYLPRYLRPDHPDFEKTDEDLKSQLLAALKRVHSDLQDEDIVATRISRSRYVFPRPIVGTAHEAPPTKTSIYGLHIVNSSHILNGTLNANETVGLAKKEAQRLHAVN